MFRTIVLIGFLAVCAFIAGWFTIDRSETETTIRFNRDEIRADTSKALAKGREFLNKNNGEQSEAEDQFGQPATGQSQFFDQNAAELGSDGFTSPAPYSADVPQQATRPIPPWQQPAPSQTPGTPRQF